MINRSLSAILVSLLVMQITSAILFAIFSDGFYAMSSGSLFKCSELLSSGGDDEVIMLVFTGLVISLLFRTLRFSSSVSFVEAFIFFFIVGIGLWAVVIGTDCGELGTTIIDKRDPYLLVFSSTSIFSALIIVYLVQSEQRNQAVRKR